MCDLWRFVRFPFTGLADPVQLSALKSSCMVLAVFPRTKTVVSGDDRKIGNEKYMKKYDRKVCYFLLLFLYLHNTRVNDYRENDNLKR